MTDAAQTDDRDALIIDCELDEPPEKVWRALTVPQLLAAWLMPNDIRPQAGARFRFAGDAATGDIDCEVLAADPHRLLRLRWRSPADDRAGGAPAHDLDSEVAFELDRTAAGGTHLRVIHSGFARAAPRSRSERLARAGHRGRRPLPLHGARGRTPITLRHAAPRCWRAAA
jgi:uncharacterized protein YndB with AHSA1/START domain